MKIYLDTCVWCRPFDKQADNKIKKETEAFFKILGKVDRKEISIVGSLVLDEEVELILDETKKGFVKNLFFFAISEKITHVPDQYKEIMELGLKIPDASHIACAVATDSECFISVDIPILSKAKSIEKLYGIRVLSPIEFLKIEGE